MKPIRKTYIINAPVDDVWEALVNPGEIEEWSGAPAKMSDEVMSDFELWNGKVYGTNMEVSHNERLLQNWYAGKWNTPSRVTLRLKAANADATELTLIHEEIPADAYRDINEGWDTVYLGPMKKYVEQRR